MPSQSGQASGQRITAGALGRVPSVTKEEYTNTNNGPYYDRAAMSNRAQHNADLRKQISDVEKLFPKKR